MDLIFYNMAPLELVEMRIDFYSQTQCFCCCWELEINKMQCTFMLMDMAVLEL